MRREITSATNHGDLNAVRLKSDCIETDPRIWRIFSRNSKTVGHIDIRCCADIKAEWGVFKFVQFVNNVPKNTGNLKIS